MAISRAQLLKELLPGLNALFGLEYAKYGEEHSEIYETETGELAAELIQKTCWRERLTDRHKPLILHSDNGSPMKAATFLEKLYDLGITPSYSRPRVSNDNAFAESAFKTLKYRPGFPVDGFATLAEAQDWVQQFTKVNEHLLG